MKRNYDNRTREQLHSDLDAKERQYQKLAKRVDYLRDKVSIQEKLTKELSRAARTHRLCCRAGILERHLIDPELLTNQQVEELISIAFAHDDVQYAMESMLQQVYDHPEATVL